MTPVSEWGLGDRQRECIEKLAELGCPKLVCREMGITTSTYRTNVAKVKKKAGLRFTMQIVAAWAAFRAGQH